jgi:tetratricopeptide (TPR) repeat protein
MIIPLLTTRRQTFHTYGLIWLILFCITAGAWADEKAEVAYAKGIMAYDNQDYLDALAHFRTVVAAEPDNADAHFYLGLTLSRLGEYQEAGEALEKTLQLDASKRYVHYHLGLVYFLQDRHEAALAQFKLAEQFDPQKAATQFYLGNTYYRLQQYELALAPLQQAMTLDTNLTLSAQYYLGLSFFALEHDELAQEALDATVASAPASALARSAQRYLEAIARRARERRVLQIQAAISYQYDDNVILAPHDDVFKVSGQGDGRMVFTLLGKLVPVRSPQWRLGVEYALYQSKQFHLHEFDLLSHTVGFFTRLKLHDTTIHLAVHYNWTYLDSTLFSSDSRFSEALVIESSATLRQTAALFAVVSAQYLYSRFFDPTVTNANADVRDRDGWAVRVGMSQYMTFNHQQSYVRLSYHYEASRNTGSDWEFDGHEVRLGLYQPLWVGLSLDAGGSFTYRDYLHVNSFDAPPLGELTAADQDDRHDRRFTAVVTLSHALGPYLTVSGSFAHISNLSNIAFFDYRRNIWTLALNGRF